jgi:hypothetical protein
MRTGGDPPWMQHRGRARSVRPAGAPRPVWESVEELACGWNCEEAEARECSGELSPIVRSIRERDLCEHFCFALSSILWPSDRRD